MKKLIVSILCVMFTLNGAFAYKLVSSKELGHGDAKNQNIVVQCTTDTGKVSTTTCSLRRYVKCTGVGDKQKCGGWAAWKDLRNPGQNYSDWRSAASACCRARGLR